MIVRNVILEYYSKNKEKIQNIRELKKKGFIFQYIYIPERFKYKIENFYSIIETATYNIDKLYNNYLNNIYEKVLNFDFQKGEGNYTCHPDIYKGVDETKINAKIFIDEINTRFINVANKFDITDPITSPFFYVYGYIDYGNIMDLKKLKINLYDLDIVMENYFDTFIYLCYTYTFYFSKYKKVDLSKATDYDLRLNYITTQYISMLFNSNTLTKFKDRLKSYYKDILRVRNEIEKIKYDTKITYDNLNINMDDTVKDLLEYNIYNVIYSDIIYDFSDKIDKVRYKYDKYINTYNYHLNKIYKISSKWEDRVNKIDKIIQYFIMKTL